MFLVSRVFCFMASTFEPKIAMGSWATFGLVLPLRTDTSFTSEIKHWESESNTKSRTFSIY